MHLWGDEWFEKYGDQFDEAIRVLEQRIRKFAHCGICGKEKWGCFTESTDVLTKDGWKSIRDITIDDEVATLKNGEYIEYNKPTDIIRYTYKGKMYKLVNRGVDIFVTPNHNLYISKGSYFKHGEKRKYPFELTTPDTYFGQDKRFKKDTQWNGVHPEEFFVIPQTVDVYDVNCKSKPYKRTVTHKEVKIKTRELLMFLGFYVAEGCTCGTGQINIAYNPYTESELADSLIRNIGFDPYTNKLGNTKIFSSAPFARWLEKNCGHGAENKQVPPFIKELDSDSIRLFLEYLYIGDGHNAKTSNILTTVSKKLSDDVCELILKCGDTFRVRIRDRRSRTTKLKDGQTIRSRFISYNINWMKNKEVEIDMSKVRKGLIKNYIEEWVDYDGEVYCCTVPNHIMYVRQNGKGYWCGNCYRDDFLTLWDGGLRYIFTPYKGYVIGDTKLAKFLHKLDTHIIPGKKTMLGRLWYGIRDFNCKIRLTRLVHKWQAKGINKAFQLTCREYPHFIDELVSDVDCYEMIKPCKWGDVDGKKIHDKYWKTVK